jgi:2-keto-4-pentenoate hydratase/2-oxohepta-3-ene-1,7-dioic acid hydratase in catechol pathway
MRVATIRMDGRIGLAVSSGGAFHARLEGELGYPGSLAELLRDGSDLAALGHQGWPELDLAAAELLPPLANPGKILCIGLNYADHIAETGHTAPTYPEVFARFSSTLIGHGAPLRRPDASTQLDFEGELAVVIGRGGRHISTAAALDHVAGYSIFNDATLRDYQFKTRQWTMGKNFDGTGAFGPVLVTPDELPAGAKGLRLRTRLNGVVMQDSHTGHLAFDVAALISLLSEVMTLAPGDVIVTGTPSGVGFTRKPPVFMQPGDVCEIELEGVGLLRNPVIAG